MGGALKTCSGTGLILCAKPYLVAALRLALYVSCYGGLLAFLPLDYDHCFPVTDKETLVVLLFGCPQGTQQR
jgi:hypothetical protein